MTDNTLKKYFTPSRSTKRVRPYSSPDSDLLDMGGDEKVGEMSHNQLVSVLGGLLDKKLAYLATKEDLVNITGKLETLSIENKALKQEIYELREQEKCIMSKLLDLEGRSRRNNLIFKGLTWKGNNPNFKDVVRNFCSEVLGMDKLWINRAHLLGRDRKTIIAHLPEDSDIDYIMSRTKMLRGTGFIVHRDFAKEVREKRARLAALRTEVERVAGKKKMSLVYDHLYLEGSKFVWEDNTLKCGDIDGGAKLRDILHHDFGNFIKQLAQGRAQGRGAAAPTRTPEITHATGAASNTQMD